MYLLQLATFARTFGAKDKKKRKSYNSLKTSVKKANTKMLYESYGGDKAAIELANNPNNKLNKKLAKQYLKDIAVQYDKDNYEAKDVNVGLTKINKKYSKYFK